MRSRWIGKVWCRKRNSLTSWATRRFSGKKSKALSKSRIWKPYGGTKKERAYWTTLRVGTKRRPISYTERISKLLSFRPTALRRASKWACCGRGYLHTTSRFISDTGHSGGATKHQAKPRFIASLLGSASST